MVLVDVLSGKHVFGLLTQESLTIAESLGRSFKEDGAAHGLRGNNMAQRGALAVLHGLGSGLLSHSVSCYCDRVGKLCLACAGVPLEGRRFWEQERYLGVNPSARARWFGGVSDAVCVSGNGCAWLSCPSGAIVGVGSFHGQDWNAVAGRI
jgi:hypothetical protein